MGVKSNNNINFVDVSGMIPLEQFERIKNFILDNGDRQTYRNYDNNNPHYRFNGFDVYLGSNMGQGNIYNDPALSDFNQLTIADRGSIINYYELIILRKEDIKNGKAWIRQGMKEEKVYLVDMYDRGLDSMEINLSKYLERIRNEIQRATEKSR